LKLNPWKISKSKHIKAWINCAENNEHESYFIEINKFTSNGYRCPLCNISKGERMIKDYLVKNNIQYIYQYKYDDLKGVGNRNLSYDFYLPKPNLLVEYQGQYHDGTSDNQTDEEFIIQQEHDKRKREYARNHNIKFLSIWYWDMGNIEDILSKELNIINQKEVS
jgi:hypothetical protein